MDLCKTDTNMSLEMNGTGLSQQGEPLGGPLSRVPSSASALAQREVVMPPTSALVASNGHLKCTCLPSIAASEIDEKIKDIVEAEDIIEASMALAEVSTASNNSKVHFNDEIQVVREAVEGQDVGEEEEEEVDDMIDLAEALYAAGVRPELLAAISEEDIFNPEDGILSDEELASGLHDIDEEEVLGLMWSEYEPQMEVRMLANDHHRLPVLPLSDGGFQPRLFSSLSEPDLLSIKLPHPSSRPIAGIDMSQLPVRRQRTWHQFNKQPDLPIIKNSLKIPASPLQNLAKAPVTVLPPNASADEPEVTSNEEVTSFV